MLAVVIAALFFTVATQSPSDGVNTFIPGHDGNGVHVIPSHQD